MEDEIRGLLPRYHDGELSKDAARRVELHLAGCSLCRADLQELRLLSATIAATAEPVTAAEAEAFWQTFRPMLDDPEAGAQRASVPWRAWLPGLLLLSAYGLLGILLWASPLLRVVRVELGLPALPLPLALVALDQLPLPGISLSNLLMFGLFGSAGVLYLVWLGFWWSRHAVETSPAHS